MDLAEFFRRDLVDSRLRGRGRHRRQLRIDLGADLLLQLRLARDGLLHLGLDAGVLAAQIEAGTPRGQVERVRQVLAETLAKRLGADAARGLAYKGERAALGGGARAPV